LTHSSPDIEIYVKRVETDEIVRWLSEYFEIIEGHHSHLTVPFSGEPGATMITLRYPDSDPTSHLHCTIVEKAVKGGFTTVWFKSNQTPWKSDAECAEAAFDFFNVEVRCSTGGWQNGDEDTGGWLRFTKDGQSIVNWLT
jgi:hypothetical protein